jgi:hypothetical protein
MRNLIKKILQETTGDEVTSFEKMRSLTNKVAKFLSRLEVDDSVCKYMLTPFVLGGGSINIMVLTTNPYQKESVINDIRLKVKTAFKGYKIDAYSFPNYDNRGCEEFEEAFNSYLQNYPESNAVFVNPKHKKTNLDEKWSEKYKKSIDCSNPKGFSQRAHCRGRKKKDLDEYSRTLKMARRQGSGTRFPKSAINSNPMRFREYSRLNEEETIKVKESKDGFINFWVIKDENGNKSGKVFVYKLIANYKLGGEKNDIVKVTNINFDKKTVSYIDPTDDTEYTKEISDEKLNEIIRGFREKNDFKDIVPKFKVTGIDVHINLDFYKEDNVQIVNESEDDKIDKIIKKGIRKVIDKEITSWGYNKDKTTVFLFDKNDKCLIDYNTKNRKLWYDHHLLDVVGRKIKTEGFLGQQFKEVLRDWFESNFEKYGYKVDPNKKVEGANIHLY